MEYMPTLIKSLLSQYRSPEIVEVEFQRILDTDSEIREEYSEWCEINGLKFKEGYSILIEEQLSTQNDVWASLCDYDDYH